MRLHTGWQMNMERHVTVLEMLPHFMMGVCTANRGHLLHYLEKSGVRLYNCTKVKALAKDGVYVEQNQSPNCAGSV